jgi:hypothetical protein
MLGAIISETPVKKDVLMADYDVYVFCNECNGVHSAELRIELQYGPVDKQSVSDLYSGGEPPAVIEMLKNSYYQCSKTGKTFFQKDQNQVFLVPV